jgi:hypothetical protein
VISEDDGSNAAVAAEAQRFAQGRKASPLSCTVQIVEPALCRLLRLQQIRGVHVVILGMGRFGEALLVELARRIGRGAVADGARLRVNVVDRSADAKVASLCLRRPDLARACELQPLEMEIDSAEFHRGAFLREADGRCHLTAVYVCIDHQPTAWSAALVLHQHLRTQGVPIIVRLEHRAGLASLLSEEADAREPLSSVHPFPLLDRTCRPDLLLGGTTEILARAIHEQYVRKQRSEGQTPATNPSMVAWDALDESLKESNRAQAAHIPLKLRAVGCDLAPLDDQDVGSFRFEADEVERLAEMEHDRWVEERTKNGWTYAPEKDVARKRSPYLVPWKDVPEEIKEYDRHFVRELPGLLSSAGYGIERIDDR